MKEFKPEKGRSISLLTVMVWVELNDFIPFHYRSIVLIKYHDYNKGIAVSDKVRMTINAMTYFYDSVLQ